MPLTTYIWGNGETLEKRVNVIQSDVLDLPNLMIILQLIKPEMVFHLAAASHQVRCSTNKKFGALIRILWALLT